MEEACGPAFADSYLSGAEEGDRTLTPRSHLAWERITASGPAMGVLKALGIRLIEQTKNRAMPQTVVSDAEYDRMSLSDKIRQRQFMADRALTEAGPMWKAGRPLAANEMPEEWHRLKAVARNHQEEAHRLTQTLLAYEGRA